MDIPIGIDLLNKDKKKLKMKVLLHAFDYIASHTNPWFAKLYVIIKYPLYSKYVKPW
jgi:hypothetical protein